MIFTDRKASTDQRSKSSEEIAPAVKAVWHCPKMRRLEANPATEWGAGQNTDGDGGASKT